MAGLNALDTDTSSTEDQPAALTKPVTPKGKFAVGSPVGAVPMSESVLQNMQRMIEQRQAQQQGLGGFIETLKDATAWTSGGIHGPTDALSKRATDRENRAAELFQLQNQLAQQKTAQAQLANIQAADRSSGWGMPQAGGTTAPGAAPVQGAPDADIVAQYNRILSTEGVAAANKFKNEYLKEKSKASFNPNLDPIVKFPIGGQMVDMTLSQAQRLARNNPQLMKMLEEIVPGSTTSAPAAAPSAAPVAGAPAAPAAPKPPVSAAPAPALAPAPATATPIRTPSATIGGGGPLPSSTDIAQRMEIEKAENLARVKGREKEFEEVGKKAGEQVNYIETALSNSVADLAGYDKLNTLVTNNPRAFGVLQNPDILSGVLKAVEQGVNVGNYNVNLPGVETLIRQAGGTKDDVTAANMAIREFARLQLNAAKLLQGQGSVSDAERRLLAQFSGSVGDDPRTIKDMIKWGKARAEYDREMGNAWKSFLKKNPGGSYRDFYINSPERDKLSEAWKKKTEEMVKDYESIGKKPTSGARAELERRRAEKKKSEGF